MNLFLALSLSSKLNFKNRHAWPVRVQSCSATPSPPIGWGSSPYYVPFLVQPVPYQKHLKLGQCLGIDARTSLSKFGDVTWPSLYYSQSLRYRSEIFRIDFRRSYWQLSKILKLPYLRITFLETSYLSVFGLCRPIIYSPDDIFQIFCRFCVSSWSFISDKNFMVLHLVVKTFTCKPLKSFLDNFDPTHTDMLEINNNYQARMF